MFAFFDAGSVFKYVFFAAFAAILAAVVLFAVMLLRRWHKNNKSPRLTVNARVVSRRVDTHTVQQGVAGDPTGGHGFTYTHLNSYYVTFEVESGDRMELSVPEAEYPCLAEGDFGKLSFQGTRYLSFERVR